MQRDFLKEIVDHKKEINRQKKAYYSSVKSNLSKSEYSRYRLFKNQISKEGNINLIAEIKKASPSKGLIREEFDILEIAKIYRDNGASAISVLTEDKYFLGNPGYVRRVSDEYNVPVLAKDFFIDEGQVYEAAVHGASAILLIVAILEDSQLKDLKDLASSLDLDCLVEVHDEKELERAQKLDAEIIGINNRDLKTFSVDINNCFKMIPHIDKQRVIVAESGIQTHEDIMKLQQAGANAVLIGETFMRSVDIAQKIKEVMYG